jgi:hypothetical protein
VTTCLFRFLYCPILQIKLRLATERTIKWYESIGFKCIGTNEIWEPGCELNWAHLDWEGASFMIGPDIRNKIFDEIKDASMYFKVDTLNEIIKQLKGKVETLRSVFCLPGMLKWQPMT